MIRAAALVLGLACAACVAAARAESQLVPWEGKSRPALAGRTLEGGTIDLKDLQGRVVLVNFWATWCGPCIEEMPSIQRLRDKLRDRPFEVLTVNYGESRERVAEFLRRERVSLPVLLDPDKEAGDAWNAKGLPMTFLVGSDGRVRYRVFGGMDWSRGEALQAVQQLVAEAPHARR